MKFKSLIPPGSRPTARQATHLSLLILVTAMVFSNTLDNDYHLDSIFRVKNNTEIDAFWPPLRFFTDKRTGSTSSTITEYRPMMPLSHAINSEIARATGTNRLAGFHVGNIAIHIGSSILIALRPWEFEYFRKLRKNPEEKKF